MKNDDFKISLSLLYSKKWQKLSISAKSLYFHLLIMIKNVETKENKGWVWFSTKSILSSLNISRASYFRAKKSLLQNNLLLIKKDKRIKIIEPREKKSDLQRLFNSCNTRLL